MKIDILKLREQPFEYEVKFSPAYLSDGSDNETSYSAGVGHVTFHMVGNDIFGDGVLQTECHSICGRCLEKATVPVKADVHLIYWPKDPETGSKIPNIEPEEPDFGVYEGDILEPDEDLREILLVETPLVPLCKDDCKGLCPRCGTNLNTGTCDCASIPDEEEIEEEVVPKLDPWKSKLQELKLQSKPKSPRSKAKK